MKKTNKSLFHSVIALILCFSMLMGTTFAWFTDEVTNSNNMIATGKLDIELEYSHDGKIWRTVKDSTPIFDRNAKWEPGYTEVVYLRISNKGSLALKYKLGVNIVDELTGTNVAGQKFKLSDYIYMGVVKDQKTAFANRTEAMTAVDNAAIISTGYTQSGTMTAGQDMQYLALVVYMPESVGNEANYKTGTTPPEINLGISLVATQMTSESDSFGDQYDNQATFPVLKPGSVAAAVTVSDGKVSQALSMDGETISATVPAGVLLNSGVTQLELSVSEMAGSNANISLESNELLRSLDVHMEGVSTDNTVPMQILVEKAMMKGLNIGNFKLFHVENGKNEPMKAVTSVAELDEHNEFFYDPATGDVVLCMATFSEIALVADTENAWKGTVATDFAGGNGTEDDPYLIANADQFVYFGDLISNDNENYGRKYYKLIANINLGGEENANKGIIFYPVGYHKVGGAITTADVDDAPEFLYFNDMGEDHDYASGRTVASPIAEGDTTKWYTYGGSFKGTFDGNGHTISNIYQNTWQLKGNYDGDYWNAAMGLFGYVYGGTIKNLTVHNFSSDGEFTPTGVIAAYAAGDAKFENIAITKCNPRVYNTGNGGIIGIAGSTSAANDDHITLKNITVDNSNKISALWGSWDVACGGLVGMYRGNVDGSGNATGDTISFENCHVSAQIDVYNDVCANYQYYAYRYSGMIIGSVRHNTTSDGKSIPNMTGISATGCTVHFGTWNDYYYCELVDNTTASYTHDYQMSRLVEIKAIDGTTITYLDGTTGTVPASGRANYVIVDYSKGHGTENATCYHFKNGEVWTHDMGGIQTGVDENGDGQDDLREDKQHLYLEFNNLFTGYGWGVSSMGIDKWNGIDKLDVTTGDHEKSVEKFKGKVTELSNNKTYKFGDIFNFVDNGVELISGALTVSITNKAENNPVSATIDYDRENWENGTITLTGTGEITITIQDYYFCTPTTITVDVTARQSEEKFDIVMNNGDFLHRVGNSGTVALDKLFKAKDGVSVGTVSVTVVAVNGTSASGTYSNNAIQFNGTGVVKVTITDNDYCTPAELYLEVVDAVNATSATSATKNNVVLLNDCGFSSLEVSGGYTLFGNGFTLTCGSDSYALDMGYSFVTLNNGTLDNVQIVTPNFDYAVLYKSNMTESGNRSYTDDAGKTRYYNVKSGVMVSGNSQILNSRISGARAAVNVTGGNCLIDNSRIELGAVASLLVGSANSLTLRDVTLVQKPTASTYDPSKTLMGFSVLFVCDADGNTAPITLEGTLVQNAWVSEKEKQYVPSAGQSIVSTVLGKTEYLHDINDDGTNESLNLGFAYMPESLSSKVNTTTITDNRTNKNDVPYDYAEVSILNGKTYVYSYKNTNGTADSFKTESEYKPNKQGDIITVTYSDTADGLETSKSFGTDGWVYELNVDLDKASGYKLDFSKLSMTVNGTTVTDFKVNGNAKPTSPVAVTAGGVTYTLTATVNDKEYTATYKVTGTETSKESPSKISGPTTAGFGVAKSYGGDWSGAADVLTGVKIKYWSVAENKYVEFDFSNFTVPGNAGKLNGTNSYWEYTHTNNDFTLKVTNTVAIHSGKSVFGMPIRGTDGKLYFTISSTNGYVGSGTTSRAVTMQYEFTDNNGGEKLTFTHTFNISYNKDDQYNYSDLSGSGKLTKLNSSSGSDTCITADTLITLADGSQVRVDSLKGDELLLVWNLETGKYEAAPIVFVDSDAEMEYEIIHLYFSDGSDVKVISEHGFFDLDLGKYVYMDATNYADYIGHRFVAEGDMTANQWNIVTLDEVIIETEVTTAWSPVTFQHLCYYTNGVLSMPGGIEGLFNIFEVDTETMTYDAQQMQKDIDTYGLFTLEDFGGMITEDAFNAFNGAYLKVAMGKGLLTWEDIAYMAERYIPLM